ncbi:YqzM-like protein OS=Ureibacillus acetophenoni OX=614649 GN=SAMN05877842_111123 PE=4 SV=1 [Ureibacillus acetophenoni]
MKENDLYYNWLEISSFFVGAVVLTAMVYLFVQ